MLYQSYDLYQRSMQAWNPFFELGAQYLSYSSGFYPGNLPLGTARAFFETASDITKLYGKPEIKIDKVQIDDSYLPIEQLTVVDKPFCKLLRFKNSDEVQRPKLLLIAALSGHHASLCKGTVNALLPHHDLYLTDWKDARDVSLDFGSFGVDDYVSYLIEFIESLGENTHVVAICQPTVQALMATAVMAAQQNPATPASLTLMAGPLDTRVNPNAVGEFAERFPSEWYEKNLIATVPPGYAGVGRKVYPGFLQLNSFMAMNLAQHSAKYQQFFKDALIGDTKAMDNHRTFYDEYLSVLDLTAEFYLETMERVFREHHLPRGIATYQGETIQLDAIKNTALMTVEAEDDDICSLGQTEAAQAMCPGIPAEMRRTLLQPDVGHYGVFNGSKFRREIAPQITDFIQTWDKR